VELDELIRTRRTQKAYEPGPVDRELLDELFELARWAPNHHLTNPWRFRVLGLLHLGRGKGTKPAPDRAPVEAFRTFLD
jgi:Nitroreductase family